MLSLLPLLLASQQQHAGITLLWCSDPVRPNETLMVQYGSEVPLTEPSVRIKAVRDILQQPAMTVTPSQVTNQTIAFTLPEGLSVDAYEITVTDDGATSNT